MLIPGTESSTTPGSADPGRRTRGSGLSVEVVGEIRPPLERPALSSSSSGDEAALELGAVTDAEGGNEADGEAEAGVVMGTVMAEEEAAAAAAAVAAATSKLQRTPAWRQREHEGLMRSQRRLKWRQRSQVLTSRICGMAD